MTMQTDPDRARAALRTIPADLPREEWVRCGMAAQAAGLSLGDFDAWSASATDRYDARDCRDVWKSFHGGGIGPGTLFHLAKQHGWQDDHPPAYQAPSAPHRAPQAKTQPNPKAVPVWQRCEPASADHGYIVVKQGSPAGLRVVPEGDPLTIAGQPLAGALAVPAYDASGTLQTLQFIPAPGRGKKLNLPGSSMSGAWFTVGEIAPGKPAYLVEGIGQAWACHRATGAAALCCFGFGNIKTVGAALKRPGSPALVIVPDVGKETQAAAVARDIGAAVAAMPTGESDNFDAADLVQRDGLDALRSILLAVETPALDRTRPPASHALIATEEELTAARLSPRCIVRHLVYADVAVLVAPGGAGKTTLSIYEAVHIALGWPLWGLTVEAPGWTLFVTAEDRREQFLARLREILKSLDLNPADRARALRGVRVWDVTGEAVKLIRAVDGNIALTALADDIVQTYAADPPAVVNFDPLVSFGASEGMINDNEQGLITAARRIVRGLDCCVKLTHHTGKGNAREGTLDQYSGRGGSALADGSRMLTVLGAWGPETPGNRQPPPGCHPAPEASITILARAKLSYAPPNLPMIWIRRVSFGYEHFTEGPRLSAEAQRNAHADRVERFLESEIKNDRRHTPTSLEAMAEDAGLTRQQLRAALAELRVSGRIVDAPLPKGQCQGSRKTYLAPPLNPAEPDGGVVPEGAPGEEPTPPPTTTPPPHRESNPGGVVPGVTSPPFLNPAADDWQGSAELAAYTDDVVIMEVEI